MLDYEMFNIHMVSFIGAGNWSSRTKHRSKV